MSIFSKLFSRENKESLDQGLAKTKESFFGKLSKAIAGKSTVDADVLDKLEEILLSGDVGVKTTINIIKRIENRVKEDSYLNVKELNNILKNDVQNFIKNTKILSFSLKVS